MKKNTSKKFSKKLSKYTALSIAIAGVTSASGQAMYNPNPDPDVSGLTGSWLDIDVDGNGVVDYQIINTATGAPPANLLVIRPAGSGYYNLNAILGSRTGPYKYPSALDFGYNISSGASIWVNDNDFQSMNWFSCAFSFSHWCSVTDKYLGFQFDIDGSTHYGWARLDVPTQDSGSMIFYDTGWNATPGAAIDAGDTGSLGVEDNLINNVKVVALNKSIAMYNLPEKIAYNLFSISGQSVLKGSTEIDTHVIEANGVATGVYILELKGTDSNTVVRKKVIL